MDKKKLKYPPMILFGLVFLLQWRTWLKLLGLILIVLGAVNLAKKKEKERYIS